MANVTGYEVVTIKTNKGNLTFPIFNLDIDIVAGTTFSVSAMSDGTDWHPLSIARSVWFSPPMIATEFESNNGRIKGYKNSSGGFFVAVYDENGRLIYEAGAQSGSNQCNCIGWTFFRGLNGVAFLSDLATNYSLYPSGQTVDFVANTLDSFGSYARPEFRGIVSTTPFQYAINMATSILSEKVPSGGDDPDPYDEIDGEGDLPGDNTLDLPPEPTTSPVDSGLFSLFAPSTAQMRSLADYLWTDFAGASDSIPEMLGEIVEALKRSVSNPLNSIFGLSIIASQGLPTGSSSSVHVGFWDTGISMPRISKQYFTVDCGSLSFQPVCGNTFLDYAPYSKFTIFLPYVGMRILDANDVVGHTISVIYRGDCVSGALVCFIKRDGKIIAEHSGNCALNLPLSADSWANTISSAARIAISGDIAPAMAGLSIGSASGAVKVAAAVATNPSALAPQVGQSGAVAGSSGHMGSQKPFILREAVRFHSTEGFNSIIGYPAFYYRKLGDCRGFTQCLDVHLNHTPATGDELKEIEELLKEGVII